MADIQGMYVFEICIIKQRRFGGPKPSQDLSSTFYPTDVYKY